MAVHPILLKTVTTMLFLLPHQTVLSQAQIDRQEAGREVQRQRLHAETTPTGVSEGCLHWATC